MKKQRYMKKYYLAKRAKNKNPKPRHGANFRKSYSVKVKVKVLNYYDQCVGKSKNIRDVGKVFNINNSLVSKWNKNRAEIFKAYKKLKYNKLLTKIRPQRKHRRLFEKLIKEFREQRDQGRKISHNWIYLKAMQINRKIQNDAEAKLSPSIVHYFTKTYHIKMRCVQRNKPLPKEAFRGRMQDYLHTTREKLIKSNINHKTYDAKYGNYPLANRFNMDEVSGSNTLLVH